jgi:hypothetical protein
MTENARDDLIEELHELLISVLDSSEAALESAEKRRKLELEAVTLNLLTERATEQHRMHANLSALNGRMEGIQESVSKLPKRARDRVAEQVAELSDLVRQSLDSGPERPVASAELKRWIELRDGHAADKKVRTDRNRITDFLEFAGDRPINKYRYSDFQSFANLLARVPADYMKERRIRHMTRQEWSGQVGMVVLTELGVRRKVVSRTNRCSAGEEFMNVRLAAAYVQEITG